MEYWSIGRRGIQNFSAEGQEKTGSSKITIHSEGFYSLLLQYSLAQTSHQNQS